MNTTNLSDSSEEVLIHNVIQLEKNARKTRWLYFSSAVVLTFVAAYWLIVFSLITVPQYVFNLLGP